LDQTKVAEFISEVVLMTLCLGLVVLVALKVPELEQFVILQLISIQAIFLKINLKDIVHIGSSFIRAAADSLRPPHASPWLREATTGRSLSKMRQIKPFQTLSTSTKEYTREQLAKNSNQMQVVE
jgi:hypothetical protein